MWICLFLGLTLLVCVIWSFLIIVFINILIHIYFPVLKRHCVKSTCILSLSGPYFPAFGLNKEIYSVNLYIQSECGKIRTIKILNTGTFYAVRIIALIFATMITKIVILSRNIKVQNIKYVILFQIFDTFRYSVPFVEFKNPKKYQWRSS